MKASCIQLISLSCMVGFQNHMAKTKVTFHLHYVNSLSCKTFLFHIHILGLTANKSQSFFYLHGPSVVFSISYKSAFMDL